MSTGSCGTLSRLYLRMSSRPEPVGRPTCSLRSKRPGRSSAGCRVEAWLVAPMTMTLYCGILGLPRCRIRRTWRQRPFGMVMPSIWISSSLTSMPPIPMPMPPGMTKRRGLCEGGLATIALEMAPREPPTASSSSMKITEPPYFLDSLRALRNSEAIRRLPTPMNMLLKLVPEAKTNGTFAEQRFPGAGRALEEDAVGWVAAGVAELLEALEQGEGLLGRGHDLRLAAHVVEGDVVFARVDHVGSAAGQEPEQPRELDHHEHHEVDDQGEHAEDGERQRRRDLPDVERRGQRVVRLDQVAPEFGRDPGITAEDAPPVEPAVHPVHQVQDGEGDRVEHEDPEQDLQRLLEGVAHDVVQGIPPSSTCDPCVGVYPYPRKPPSVCCPSRALRLATSGRVATIGEPSGWALQPG